MLSFCSHSARRSITSGSSLAGGQQSLGSQIINDNGRHELVDSVPFDDFLCLVKPVPGADFEGAQEEFGGNLAAVPMFTQLELEAEIRPAPGAGMTVLEVALPQLRVFENDRPIATIDVIALERIVGPHQEPGNNAEAGKHDGDGDKNPQCTGALIGSGNGRSMRSSGLRF